MVGLHNCGAIVQCRRLELKRLFRANTAALSVVSTLALSGMVYASELDGKKAVCNFSKENGLRGKDVFLSFSGNKVTKLDILVNPERNSDYNFDYKSVELNKDTTDFYLKPTSIFWGNFSSEGVDNSLPSREDISIFLLLNRNAFGGWTYIDRTTLLAEEGVVLLGKILTHTGKCEISDEVGEKEFTDKYKELKVEAARDFNTKLENAKSKAPKL